MPLSPRGCEWPYDTVNALEMPSMSIRPYSCMFERLLLSLPRLTIVRNLNC